MQVQANEVIALKEFLQLSEEALSTWVYHKVVAAASAIRHSQNEVREKTNEGCSLCSSVCPWSSLTLGLVIADWNLNGYFLVTISVSELINQFLFGRISLWKTCKGYLIQREPVLLGRRLFSYSMKTKLSKSLSCITFSMIVSVTDSKEQTTKIIHRDVRKTQPLPAFLRKISHSAS